MKPLISIVLPIYNVSAYLPRCMDALFKQTYKNIEILMIDDGSKDNSGELCDQYAKEDPRVVVFHKENGGLSDARNYGIKRATGEYITCIDPDDDVDIDYVEYLYMLLEKYDTKMSICQLRVSFENGKIKDNGYKGDEELSAEFCLERMLYHDVIDTTACAKLYHKSLFENIEYPFGKLFEDIGTTYALMMECDGIAVGYETKYSYMIRDGSIVTSEFNIKKLDLLEMTDKMAADVLVVYPSLQSAVQRRRVYARLSTLNQMLDTESCSQEKAEIIEFIKANRKNIISDPRAPKRDKIAVILLSISYNLYKWSWKRYQSF